MYIEVIGWAGALAVLLAYLLVSTGKLSAKKKVFQLLNLFGAIGIIINSSVHRALPSVVLNIVWLLIAAYELLRIVKKGNK